MDKEKARQQVSQRGDKKDVHFWMPTELYDLIAANALRLNRSTTAQAVQDLEEKYYKLKSERKVDYA